VCQNTGVGTVPQRLPGGVARTARTSLVCRWTSTKNSGRLLEAPDGNVVDLVASVLPDWPQAFPRSREEAP
jgi:hypothetical protein